MTKQPAACSMIQPMVSRNQRVWAWESVHSPLASGSYTACDELEHGYDDSRLGFLPGDVMVSVVVVLLVVDEVVPVHMNEPRDFTCF